MTPTLDALVRQLREAMAQATPEPWTLANLSNFQINAGGARAIVCQSTHDARYLLLSSPANMTTLLDALTAAQRAHHQAEESRRTNAQLLDAAYPRIHAAEAEAARLRAELEQWKSCNLYPQSYREAVEQVSALQGELAEAQQAQKVLARQLERRASGQDELTVLLTAERDAAREALRKVSDIAHAGGLHGLSDADALVEIRGLTLSHWNRSGTEADLSARVKAALGQPAEPQP